MKVMNFIKKEIIINNKYKKMHDYLNKHVEYKPMFHANMLNKKNYKKNLKFLSRIFSDYKIDKSNLMEYDSIFKYFRISEESVKFFIDLMVLMKKLKLKSKKFKIFKFYLRQIKFNNLFIIKTFKFLVLNTYFFNFSYYYLHIMPFLSLIYFLYIKKLSTIKFRILKYNNLYDIKFIKKNFNIKNLNKFFNLKFLYYIKKNIIFIYNKKKLKIKNLNILNLTLKYEDFNFYSYNFTIYKLLLVLCFFWLDKILKIKFLKKFNLLIVEDDEIKYLDLKLMKRYQIFNLKKKKKIYERFPGDEDYELKTLNIVSCFYFYNNYKFFINFNG